LRLSLDVVLNAASTFLKANIVLVLNFEFKEASAAFKNGAE
jgi:hypothetical protein